MKSLWLYLFPLLFLPNLGITSATQFGTLEISDFLIFPYLFLLIYGRPRRRGLLIDEMIPLMVMFAVWAAISTLSITVRYPEESNFYISYGLLKLAKLTLYVTVGALTSKKLTDAHTLRRFHWVLLVTGVVIAIGLITTPGEGRVLRAGEVLEGFKTNNGVSVLLAITTSYVAAMLALGWGTLRWRRYAIFAIGCMALGVAFSGGRGGWLAAVAATIYLLYRRGFTRRMVVTLAVGIAVLIPTYFLSDPFRIQVNRTVAPDPEFLQQYNVGVLGIDDGGRVGIWVGAAKRSLLKSPLWGAGFFHRSVESGLYFNGSHNFFLQMFLETGFIGGALILMIFWRMWRHAGVSMSRKEHFEVPLKCALIAAFVGGLGGEYFYGGMPVLTLITVYGPVGALPFRQPVLSVAGSIPARTAGPLSYSQRLGTRGIPCS